MSLKNLFYLTYWFKQPSILHGGSLLVWVLLFLALVLAGLGALWQRNNAREQALRVWLNKVSACTLTMGFFGLIWLFFREQVVPFLAWRFWLMIWLVIFLVWFLPLVVYWFKRLPQIRAVNAERARKEKYLR